MNINIIKKYLTVYKHKNISLPQAETNAYIKGYLDSLFMYKIITTEEWENYIKNYTEKVNSDI